MTPYLPEMPPLPRYSAGKRELRFAAAMTVCCIFLWNAILYGGFHLGFSIGAVSVILCTVWYLTASGCRFDRYSSSLVACGILIAGGYAVAPAYLKFFMLAVLLLCVNLGFCLAAGQNRRDPGSPATVLDAFRTCFRFGFGGMSPALRGLNDARKSAGAAGRKGFAVIAGLAAAVPLGAVMVWLLIRADAAFEGLMNLLPETDWSEPVWSVLFGGFAAWVLYARALGLRQREKESRKETAFRGISPITVNIPLLFAAFLYLVYLLSQLSYMGGGFAGILPEGYTLAQYARRGFFEMAWLSGINLGVICLTMGLVEQRQHFPGLTRALCLFLGAITLFLIAAASAKMLLYIASYGLTRLRILTEIFMLWLAVTTVLVCLRLFRPAYPYMKKILLAGLLICTLTFWADVDGRIAQYNVHAYQTGKIQTIDLAHLRSLGPSAAPYVARLLEDENPEIALRAEQILRNARWDIRDFRDWNLPEARARKALEQALSSD